MIFALVLVVGFPFRPQVITREANLWASGFPQAFRFLGLGRSPKQTPSMSATGLEVS